MTLRTSLLSAAMLCGALAATPAFAAGIGMSGNTSTMITPPAATTSATGNVTAPVPSAAPVTGTVRNTAGTTAGAAVNGTAGDVNTDVNADTNGNTDANVDAAATPNDATRHGDHPATSSASGHVGTDTH